MTRMGRVAALAAVLAATLGAGLMQASGATARGVPAGQRLLITYYTREVPSFGVDEQYRFPDATALTAPAPLCGAAAKHVRMRQRPRVLPVFASILPQLKKARIPVYLPTWLPWPSAALYPSARVYGGQRRNYSVDLAPAPHGGSIGTVAFRVTGRFIQEQFSRVGTRRVTLCGGRTGWLMPGLARGRLALVWQSSGALYVASGALSRAQLIQVANGMIRVR